MKLVITILMLFTLYVPVASADLPSSHPEILPEDRSDSGMGDMRARPNFDGLRADADGEIGEGEFQIISADGTVTRRPCPYTCEMRGIPEGSCRMWQSQMDPEICYVQDTRAPQNAVVGK